MVLFRVLLILSFTANSVVSVAHASPLESSSEGIVGGTRPIAPVRPLRPLVKGKSDQKINTDPDALKVLKLDNDEGVIIAYRCLLAGEELTKPEPQETDCVRLGRVRPMDLQQFAYGDRSCRSFAKEQIQVVAVLALAASFLGSAVGIVVGSFTEQFWRYGLGMAAGAALVGGIATYYFGVAWCEHGLNMVIDRLYDEVQRKVPVNRTRLIPVDDRTWRAFDVITASAN